MAFPRAAIPRFAGKGSSVSGRHSPVSRGKALRSSVVIPAKAGIHVHREAPCVHGARKHAQRATFQTGIPAFMDSRFRGNDGEGGGNDGTSRRASPPRANGLPSGRHSPVSRGKALRSPVVIPAKAGIHVHRDAPCLHGARKHAQRATFQTGIPRSWIPAFTGMTGKEAGMTELRTAPRLLAPMAFPRAVIPPFRGGRLFGLRSSFPRKRESMFTAKHRASMAPAGTPSAPCFKPRHYQERPASPRSITRQPPSFP